MAYYNTTPITVSAKVRRWADAELCDNETAVQELIEHCIREYGESTAEWLEGGDQNPIHFWSDYWEENRDLVSGYGPPNRSKIVLNETQTVNLYEDAVDELDCLIESMDRGLGSDQRKDFISALLLSNREQLSEDVENGDVAGWKIDGED